MLKSLSARIRVVSFFLSACAVFAEAGPLRVYVLAGQSNMEGHGYAEPVTWLPAFDRPQASLTNLAKHATWGNEFKKFLPTGGKYPARTDVWCHYQLESRKMVGDLSIGYGANDTSRAWNIGPEVGFGWVTGDANGDQVLLIKTAWGGKSLAKDFRPPSAGGTVGPYYTKMITQVKEVLADIKKHFPAYDGKGYRLAGFAWHQGWNDLVNTAYVDEYESNLYHFIRDIRKDWGVADLPVVIAESGMACWDAKNATAQKLCAAQAAPSLHAEFKATTGYVKARDYYDTSLAPWKDWGFHWHGSFYSYYRVGKGLGEAMLKLDPAGPTAVLSPAKTAPGTQAVSWTAQGLRWNRASEVEAWSSQGRRLGRWRGGAGEVLSWEILPEPGQRPILRIRPVQ